MTVRQYAKAQGFQIVGTLTRKPEWETKTNEFGEKVHDPKTKCYVDDAGNNYWQSAGEISISTPDGDVL